jgi:diacylglycerol kinase family enzyme
MSNVSPDGDNVCRNGTKQEIGMKVTLIHNPEAGKSRFSGSEILRLIREAGHSASYQSTEDDDWETALKEPGDIVAIAGGDGSVGKVARRLVGRSIPIAVLPLGTANNISKALGLAETPIERLIAEWDNARSIKFDVGIATGPWGSTCFIESLGAGLFAGTMSRLDARDNIELAHLSNAEDKMSYVLNMLSDQLRDFAVKKLTVSLDGEDRSGEYILLEAMNIGYIGPNLNLAPDAAPGDGLLDVVLLTRGEEDKLINYLEDRVTGAVTLPTLTTLRCREMQVVWEGFDIHIDDEAWPRSGSSFPLESANIDVKVDDQALEFLVSPK